eukprot:4860613-Amphidinium_carterae.2
MVENMVDFGCERMRLDEQLGWKAIHTRSLLESFRPNTTKLPTNLELQINANAEVGVQNEQINSESVSYTHLTLPTILLV